MEKVMLPYIDKRRLYYAYLILCYFKHCLKNIGKKLKRPKRPLNTLKDFTKIL